MLIGVPRETKDHEYRVELTPDSVNEAVLHGHDVVVERRSRSTTRPSPTCSPLRTRATAGPSSTIRIFEAATTSTRAT